MVVDRLGHSAGEVEHPQMMEEYLAVVVEVLAVVGGGSEGLQWNNWRVSNPCYHPVVTVGCLEVEQSDKAGGQDEGHLVVMEVGRMMYSFPVEGKGHKILAVTADGQYGG